MIQDSFDRNCVPFPSLFPLPTGCTLRPKVDSVSAEALSNECHLHHSKCELRRKSREYLSSSLTMAGLGYVSSTDYCNWMRCHYLRNLTWYRVRLLFSISCSIEIKWATLTVLSAHWHCELRNTSAVRHSSANIYLVILAGFRCYEKNYGMLSVSRGWWKQITRVILSSSIFSYWLCSKPRTKSTILSFFLDCFMCQIRLPNFIFVYAQNRRHLGLSHSRHLQVSWPSRANEWVGCRRPTEHGNRSVTKQIRHLIPVARKLIGA